MNLLDYGLLLILIYCLIRGVFRGLIRELSSIIGVLGGFYAAYSYYPLLSEHMLRWITRPAYARIVSFLLLFIAVYLLISITGMMIKYLMNIAFLGWTDRSLGALFGVMKGVLVVAVMVAMLTTFLPKDLGLIKNSFLVRRTMGISSVLVRTASIDMKHFSQLF